MVKGSILGIAALVFALPSWSGEIIGNTFIGEKYGKIEIQSPDGKWNIEDREAQVNNIARLTLKDRINGTQPSIGFRSIPNAGGGTLDLVMQTLRDTLVTQGWEVDAIEPKRFGGKLALTLTGRLTKGNASGTMYLVVLEGQNAFFLVSGNAITAAYGAAKPLFEEVIEKLKY